MEADLLNNTEFVQKCRNIAENYKTLYVMGCIGANMNEKNKARYTENHSYNKKEDDVSRKSLFKTLLYKILQVFVGLFLTNVLWIIPFGFIICIGIIINGVIGAGKALKALLHFNAGGK